MVALSWCCLVVFVSKSANSRARGGLREERRVMQSQFLKWCLIFTVVFVASCASENAVVQVLVDAGASIDAGATVDAGDPCMTSPGDVVLGTLSTVGTAMVTASAALPAGIMAVTQAQGVLYGLNARGEVSSLGTWPTISSGHVVAHVIAPQDADAGVYVSGFFTSTGTQLLAGYTGSGFSGQVAVVELGDAGVHFVNAPGNFGAVGTVGTFVINGLGLGSISDAGVFALRVGSTIETSVIASFDPSLNASASGATVMTNDGVLLIGYSTSPNYENVVRAVAPGLARAALDGGAAIALSAAQPVVAQGFDVMGVDAFGSAALVTSGGYDSKFSAYTTSVKRVPLTVSGDSVLVGSPLTLLQENGSRCTRVLFTSTSDGALYVAVQDRRGARLVKLTP